MVLSVTAFWYPLNFVKADTRKRLRTSNFEFFFASFFKRGHAHHGAHQLKARADSAPQLSFLLGFFPGGHMYTSQRSDPAIRTKVLGVILAITGIASMIFDKPFVSGSVAGMLWIALGTALYFGKRFAWWLVLLMTSVATIGVFSAILIPVFKKSPEKFIEALAHLLISPPILYLVCVLAILLSDPPWKWNRLSHSPQEGP